MRKLNGNTLFAAHDLERFLSCSHAIFLDLRNLEEPLPKAEDDDQARLLQEKGLEHELAWLEKFRQLKLRVAEIPKDGSLFERVKATREALATGADIIYQAALHSGRWHGYADFLRRKDPAGANRPIYEVIDTKLARATTPSHIIQLCVYTELLSEAQGCTPASMSLILGDGRESAFRFADFTYYFRIARGRFEEFAAQPPGESYPEPCRACERCGWRDLCAAQWEKDNHLSLVANIQSSQIEKLRTAGVSTVRALAQLPENASIPKLTGETLTRLRSQAQLQTHKADTGENKAEILPAQEGRGFARMPKPDPGDLLRK
jgi:predicted RecB family nuclease